MVALASSPSLTKLRRRVRLEDTAAKVAGWLIVAGLAFWIIANIVKSPSQFFAAFLSGINNGALYALVALGYTMVYGIIELINFSHGDLFMLSTIFAAFVVVTTFGATTADWWSAVVIGIAMIVVMSGA